MMSAKFTPGPWKIGTPPPNGEQTIGTSQGLMVAVATTGAGVQTKANAILIAAAPELMEALRECVDAAWFSDSHAVRFDGTVVFSEFYDFRQLNSARREEFLAQYDCVIWPGHKWSAYCTYEGSMWFEQFDSAEEAKEQCMRLLDTVLPEHPVMKARAAISKAEAFLAAPQPSADEPVTDSYVQTVPDKCDRIVWRGRYIHLSVGQETTTQPFEDGWIPWKGGECPVGRRDVVMVKGKNGEVDTDKAHFYDWHHTGSPFDIIAYRVVKQ